MVNRETRLFILEREMTWQKIIKFPIPFPMAKVSIVFREILYTKNIKMYCFIGDTLVIYLSNKKYVESRRPLLT